ncbi:MAG: LysR family transcriptional regulator substrate-binding protein, partial [Verrucomicrobiota bacterium]|nr:LysR family transcriptional regulator substrate-binding protein [Verrucomicrobiota bacterium]
LTPAGNELYTFLSPFFSKLPLIAEQLRGEESSHLRLAAERTVLANHLPTLLDQIKKGCPNLRLTINELGAFSNPVTLLENQDIDIAITSLHSLRPSSVKTLELLRIPLILIVPDKSNIKSFSSISKVTDGKIMEPMISLSAEHSINTIFQKELDKRELVWNPIVEVTSLDLISNYVNRGYGIGLTLDAPGMTIPKGLRKINLRGFAPLKIGILFQGKLKPIAEKFALAAVAYAKKIK